MAKQRRGGRNPFTFRIELVTLAALKERAQMENLSISALVRQAVDEFLHRQTPVIPEGILLTANDLERAALVVQAIGTPAPLAMVLKIIEIQRQKVID